MKSWRVGILALFSAIACQGDRGYPPGPSAEIADGYHGSGNQFFYWLPPVVNQQPPAEQVFSRQLRPTIVITNLCTGAVVRSFSGSEIELSDSHFQANWHTADDSLNPVCDYRLLVKVGNYELGMADVDVVDDGRELRNVNTGEFIPLLADRTLPIKFFIGIGSHCIYALSDCGEGTVLPGENTTIVTKGGQAGVFVPAGAVDQPVTLIIESSDERPCIPGLEAPVYSGSVGAVGNSCYDFRVTPPLAEVNQQPKFNTNVTVGICAEVDELDHATRDLLQIFQFDVGRDPAIRALPNAGAPFLRCDPGYVQSLGMRSLLKSLAQLFGPKPLMAGTRVAMDVGTGGSTDEFSRFTWALPNELLLNFDRTPEGRPITPGATLNTLYSRLGVTFSRTTLGTSCVGSGVYANDWGVKGPVSGQNHISVCPGGDAAKFAEVGFGVIIATFTVPSTQACIDATPLGLPTVTLAGVVNLGGTAYIEAYDEAGQRVSRTETSTEQISQRVCVSGSAIKSVRFAGSGSGFAVFDNFYFSRAKPQS